MNDKYNFAIRLHCSFRDVGKILGQGIRKTTVLERLDLSNNPLTAEDLLDLVNSVIVPTSLKVLGITHVLVDEQLANVSHSEKRKRRSINTNCFF